MTRGCVIMAHLGRRPRASGSVIDLSQLPSPSPSGSYHLNHSDSTLSIRMQKRRWSNFDTAPCCICYAVGLAEAEFFAGLELRFGGQTVEAAELAHGDTVARGYAAEGVATADGIGSGG